MNRRVAWVALALVVIVALAIAFAGGDESGGSPAKRGRRHLAGRALPDLSRPIGGRVGRAGGAGDPHRDPSPRRRRVSRAARSRRISEDRYGSDILLTPPSGGLGGLVWVIPIVVIVGAGAGLVVALQRWSRRPLAHATDDDRLLVAKAEEHR